ncbi:MAG: cellulase family glycosylhydrolase, partial [Limosilactobacillus mucosae]|nr:cellulase family glycosylhydrolase [Limosilactobacillus mucosae]
MEQDKIKGVNLGGWLVLEKWMAPHLFDGTNADDEYYLPQELSEKEYLARITQHRSNFITEADFLRIASTGFNLVRIPVPYFIFGDRKPFIGAIAELDRAFNWAEAYGLKILIDLHTAPDSQNGFDNGGISGVCKWAQEPAEVEFELSVLERLAKRYHDRTALYGIEVLNEPATEKMFKSMTTRYLPRDPKKAAGSAAITFEFLYDFYQRAYEILRPILPNDKVIMFHDGFDLSKWHAFFTENDFENVVLDTHQYLMVAEMEGAELNPAAYEKAMNKIGDQIAAVNKYVPVFVGEWTLFNSYTAGINTQGGINPT